jgi:hypothetical protein
MRQGDSQESPYGIQYNASPKPRLQPLPGKPRTRVPLLRLFIEVQHTVTDDHGRLGWHRFGHGLPPRLDFHDKLLHSRSSGAGML